MSFSTILTEAELEALRSEGEATPEGINSETEVEATVQTPEVDNEEDSFEEESTVDDLEAQKESIRKEAEREAKRKYLSQVSKKDKELKEALKQIDALKGNYDEGSLDDINRLVDYRIAEREKTELARKEESSFFRKYPEMKQDRGEIEAILEDFPNMSWEAARTFYLAQHRPDALVQSNKSKSLNMKGSVPTNATQTDLSDEKQIEMEARKELEEMMRGY